MEGLGFTAVYLTGTSNGDHQIQLTIVVLTFEVMLPTKLILEIMGVQCKGCNVLQKRILWKSAKTNVSATTVLHLPAYQTLVNSSCISIRPVTRLQSEVTINNSKKVEGNPTQPYFAETNECSSIC
jgi:hypothetical protein